MFMSNLHMPHLKRWMLWLIPVTLSVIAFVGYPYAPKPEFMKPVQTRTTSYTDVSLEYLVAYSDLIVHGTITDQEVVDNPDGSKWKMIRYTVEPIEVVHTLQGYIQEPIQFHSYTGIFPNKIRKDERSPILRVGDTALFFIHSDADGNYYSGSSGSTRVSENGSLLPFEDAELAPTMARQVAEGYATLQKVRDLAREVPYDSRRQVRLEWAGSFTEFRHEK